MIFVTSADVSGPANGLLNKDAGIKGDSGKSKPDPQHGYWGDSRINYIFRIELRRVLALPRELRVASVGPIRGSRPKAPPLSAFFRRRPSMMPRWRTLVVLLLAMLCAAAAILLDFASPSYYRQAEFGLRDAIARSGRMTPANPDLLFLAIHSDSVSLDETLDLEGLFSSSSGNPELVSRP